MPEVAGAPLLSFAELALVQRESLRPAERRVVEYLVEIDPAAAAATAGAVADALGVSQATVVSAVQRVGYAGFGDFRRRFIAERAAAGAAPEQSTPTAAPGDPLLEICRRAMLEDIAAIGLTVRVLDATTLRFVSRTLADAPYVLCIGTEWTGVVARMAAGTFTKYGIRATGEEIGVEQLSLVEIVDERTVVLAMSHRGRNEHLLRVVERARARGLTVIALTHRATSRLARMASAAVVCAGLELAEGTHPNQTGGPATYLTLVRALAESVAWLRAQGEAVRPV